MRIKCPNYLMKEKTKNSKGKVLVATLSDSENNISDKYEDECGYYMVFVAIIDKVIVESASDSENSSNNKVLKKLTLQEAYDKLYTEFIKSEKTSHLCRKELNEVKIENGSENDLSDEYEDECGYYMVFAAAIDKVIVKSASDSEDSSNNEVPKKLTLQEAISYALNL